MQWVRLDLFASDWVRRQLHRRVGDFAGFAEPSLVAVHAGFSRIERLEAEKKDIAEQQKEVMAEAKARGYDTKVMRKVIALRKRDKDDIAEEEAILEMYKEALGM